MRHVLALAFGFFACASAAQADCRQALALGLDVSGSVDSREYRLQLDGLAGALLDRDVRKALLEPALPPVALAVFTWSGPDHQRLLQGWTRISHPSDIIALANRLRSTQRQPGDPSTAIGAARAFGVDLLAQRPDCWKHTLDLSADGKSNTGPHPRTLAVPAHVTVNALVIGADSRSGTEEVGELAAYYTAFVIAGPDAFVQTALGFDAYQAAMIRKLKRELQGLILSRR